MQSSFQVSPYQMSIHISIVLLQFHLSTMAFFCYVLPLMTCRHQAALLSLCDNNGKLNYIHQQLLLCLCGLILFCRPGIFEV